MWHNSAFDDTTRLCVNLNELAREVLGTGIISHAQQPATRSL